MNGPYDRLYESRPGVLWPTPGRLVRRAHEWLPAGSTVHDVGCGDGKNALFLEQRGYSVRGCDVSRAAIARLRCRFAAASRTSTQYVIADAFDVPLPRQSIDCLLSYGFFHCLPPSERVCRHRELQDAVRFGGLVLFSALLDTRELDPSHLTPDVTPASAHELSALFSDFDVLDTTTATITEDHSPLVGVHTHDAAWVVARRL